MSNIIGLKEFRNNVPKVINAVRGGQIFTVVNRSTAVFKITPVVETEWEEVADFTSINANGVVFDKVVKFLRKKHSGQNSKTSRKTNK